MRSTRQTLSTNHRCSLKDLPRAIWLPSLRGNPVCYQGSPLEIVEEMACGMKLGLGVHDAIDLLLRSLADERGINIKLPDNISEAVRASGFVYALILSGVAREMAQA